MTISFEIFGVQAAELLSEMHRMSFLQDPWSAEAIELLLMGSGVFAMVVTQTEQPIGFLMWREVAGEAEILTICILPEHRTKGVASHLLQKFYSETKDNGVSKIFLEVNENNKAAIILYEKNGFEAVGRRKDYYGGKGCQKQDALIMKFSW